MKNKNILILLAIAAGLYFVTKKKKKGTVETTEFLPLQGNEEEILKQEKYVYPGEMATLSQVQTSRELPKFPTTIEFLTNKILPVVKKQVVKKTAKKTQAKKTTAKKTRAQKLGELGALYL
jgi:hypothetical protein